MLRTVSSALARLRVAGVRSAALRVASVVPACASALPAARVVGGAGLHTTAVAEQSAEPVGKGPDGPFFESPRAVRNVAGAYAGAKWAVGARCSSRRPTDRQPRAPGVHPISPLQ